MKNCLSCIVLAWALCIFLPFASAQHPHAGGYPGGQVFEPPAIHPVQADLTGALALPGRVWVSANFADQGLGYVGSYFSLGTKTRLFEDFLDGRWLSENRFHLSENGGFFGNFGIERVFTIDAAGADVSMSGWFDYDDDQGEYEFADAFTAWGATAQIKTRYWDVIANGYFPFGSTNNSFGDPTGANSFFENRVIVLPGIDSVLEGFDVTLCAKPEQLAFVNGSVDFGGYGYQSDLVDFFGGARTGLSFQMLRGWILSGTINYDERFDLTGVVGLTYVRGGGGRGDEYAGVARDLERTPRNDHIVRFNQQVELAIDPDTGAPYNVIHVDNTAAPDGNGNFESPFDSLADAEAAGMDDDIIFVNDGDGTVTGYDTGIALRNGQLLLGDGVRQLIPIQGGVLFELSNDQDGLRPTITGRNNGNAVTLASRNTVRGFVIDGDQSVGGMANGIFGSGGITNNTGIIEDNMITGAILDGIGITNLAGDWTFARNNITDNGFNGIRLTDACDPTSVFTFADNIVNDNGLDGIQIFNYDALEINFISNVTSGNGRDGVRLERFKGDPAVGVDIFFFDHIARFNNGVGINIIDGTGSVTVMSSIIGTEEDPSSTIQILGGNLGHGISIVDFETPNAGDQILISGNDINGNGVGGDAGLNIELNEGTARALITGNRIDQNGIGIRVAADDQDPMNGIATSLDIDIVDNGSVGSGIFGGNLLDGMRFIANGGASLNLLVDQTDNNLLGMIGNGAVAGNGISFLVGDDSNGIISNLTAIVRNVAINGSGGDGVFANVVEDGQLSLLFENSVVNANADAFDFNLDTNETLAVNSIAIRNVTAANNAFSGFELTTGAGTFTDVAVINSAFINPALGGGRPTGVGGPGFAGGMVINAIGDAGMMNPQLDNRTRLFIQGNTIDRYTLDGLAINTSGDASVLATIDGNVITNNGDGFQTIGQPDLPFFDGISLIAAGSSSINTRITNNLITGNAEAGLEVQTFGASTVNALLDNNNLALNDFTDDINTVPIESGNNDFLATNAAGSNICLSLSNNFLVFPDLLINNGAMADFVVELDGITNIGFVVPANITEAAFGSTCEPAVAAEELAYLLDGFPPSPPPVVNP